MGHLPEINISVDRALAHSLEWLNIDQDEIQQRINEPDITHPDSLSIHFSALALKNEASNTLICGYFSTQDKDTRVMHGELRTVLGDSAPPDITIYVGTSILMVDIKDSDASKIITDNLNETVAHELEHYLQKIRGELQGNDDAIKNKTEINSKIFNLQFNMRLSRILRTLIFTGVLRYQIDPMLAGNMDIVEHLGVGYAASRAYETIADSVKKHLGRVTTKEKIRTNYLEAFEVYETSAHEVAAKHNASKKPVHIIDAKISRSVNTETEIITFYPDSLSGKALMKIDAHRHRSLSLRPPRKR